MRLSSEEEAAPGHLRRASGPVASPAMAPAGGEFAVSEEQLGWVIANHVRARRLEIGQSVGQLASRTGIEQDQPNQ